MKKDTILIVDDEPLNRLLLEKVLDVHGFECRSAKDGAEALAVLDSDIDLVLLDVNMPEITGFEVARRIREGANCSDVPIIMVTALSSMQDRLNAVQAGANDFICKPVDHTELLIRASAQLRVKHAQDAVKSFQRDLESQVLHRTSELQEANEKLSRLATTDALTGLFNHRNLVDVLELEIEKCTANDSMCSVLFIDLDHFKALNDSCGHGIGDAVLVEFGGLLEESMRPYGVCGRWGGEEFVCILPGISGATAKAYAEEFRRKLAQYLFRAGGGCHMTCSIGVATFPQDGHDRSSIAEAADKAMYVAKALGRNQVRGSEDVSTGFEALRANPSTREEVALEGLVEALATMVSYRDECTGSHTADVGELSQEIARELGLGADDIRFIGLIGKLHDIGKVAIPDSILLKDGPLSSDEWLKMREHPQIGSEVINRVPTLRALAPAIRAHHERWDGTGYPDQLAGDEIPLAAQIVSVADAYCAITTNRPYRKAATKEHALEEVRRNSGTQFNPAVVSALMALLAEEKAAA